jgi:hypothetical protein
MDLVALIQAACQLFKKPPLDPTLERPFHPYLRGVRNIERCGLVQVSLSTGFGDRIEKAPGNPLAGADEERGAPCIVQVRLGSWLSLSYGAGAGTSSKQNETVHPRPVCLGEECGSLSRICMSMLAVKWLTDS